MARGMLWLLLAPLLVGSASARLELAITPPAQLRQGDHGSIVLTLRLPASADRMVLLTPATSGGALEVVRGRLLRADARDPAASPLVFDLPVVAHGPGASVLEIHARGFVCSERGCETLESTARANVLVLPRQ